MATICTSSNCNAYNGACNMLGGSSGCTCNLPDPLGKIYSSDGLCDCKNNNTCEPNGVPFVCNADGTVSCLCNPGFSPSTSAHTDCWCAGNAGLCYGGNTAYTCGTCACLGNYTSAVSTAYYGAVYNIAFGSNTPSGFSADTGAVSTSHAIGLYSVTYGWASINTGSITANSNCLSSNQWSITTVLAESYDVQVTIVSSSANVVYITNGDGSFGPQLLTFANVSAGTQVTSTSVRVPSGTTGVITIYGVRLVNHK